MLSIFSSYGIARHCHSMSVALTLCYHMRSCLARRGLPFSVVARCSDLIRYVVNYLLYVLVLSWNSLLSVDLLGARSLWPTLDLRGIVLISCSKCPVFVDFQFTTYEILKWYIFVNPQLAWLYLAGGHNLSCRARLFLNGCRRHVGRRLAIWKYCLLAQIGIQWPHGLLQRINM